MGRKNMDMLFGIIAGVMGICLQAGAATVGHWRFEEGAADTPASGTWTVLDSSGNNLHGTPVAGPAYRADVPAMAGGSSTRSLEFDGISGQRVTIPDVPVLALTKSLTLEAFIKAKPLRPGTGGVGDIVFRADNRPGFDPYLLGLQGPGNVLSLQIVNEANQVALLTAQVPYGEWLHVAGTLDDATGSMRLYVNGEPVAEMVTSIRPLGPLAPAWSPGVSIGNDFTGQYGQVFNGWIDEVRISDIALAPSAFLPEPGAALLILGGIALLIRRSAG